MAHWTDYIGLIGIPVIFIAIVIYVYRPGAKKRYQKDAKMPFEEDPRDKQDKN